MTKVIALTSFDHGGKRSRGDMFDVSEQVASALRRNGLVRIADDPMGGSGEKSSASPAAQVSQKQTARKSTRGVRRGRVDE